MARHKGLSKHIPILFGKSLISHQIPKTTKVITTSTEKYPSAKHIKRYFILDTRLLHLPFLLLFFAPSFLFCWLNNAELHFLWTPRGVCVMLANGLWGGYRVVVCDHAAVGWYVWQVRV